MPSLAEAIAANIRTKGPRCMIGLLIPKLSKEQLADFNAAMGADEIPATAIAEGLAEVGHTTSIDSLQRHRRGRCACAR